MSNKSLCFLVNITVHPSTVNSVIQHVWGMGYASYANSYRNPIQSRRTLFFVSVPVWECFYMTQQIDG